jgi:hypothetical protein
MLSRSLTRHLKDEEYELGRELAWVPREESDNNKEILDTSNEIAYSEAGS